MTTLPTSPFPELRPLEESRQVPSLADLLSSRTSLPVQTAPPPVPKAPEPAPTRRAPLRVSRLPSPQHPTSPKRISPGILAEMPVVPPDQWSTAARPTSASIAEYMAAPPAPAPAPAPVKQFPVPAAAPISQPRAPLAPAAKTPKPAPAATERQVTPPAPTEPASLAPGPVAPPAPEPAPATPQPIPVSQRRPAAPSTTDEEFKDALLPILEATIDKALNAPGNSLYTHLEPMLRSTVRRAIAEQMESSGQFRDIGAADRLAWRLNALFTSRSYDEIVFERTRRYQVEELFLLRKKSHALISYASHDPVRHASLRRVESTVEMLASKLFGPDGELQDSFDLPERRVALVRTGRHALLVAVLRGSSNALVRADLDYVLRQTEERLDARLQEETDTFVHALQPILEGGLLIQSPAPPR